MPARLPDVDLAPAEGAPPPQAGVQPTTLGLTTAGEALGQAATVGFRAGAIATRAQAAEDAKAIAPQLDDLKGQLQADATREKYGYQGEPGLGARMSAAGQGIYAEAYAQAQKTMTAGQLAQFERGGRGLLGEHQALSWEIQAAHQATAIGEAVKAKQDAELSALTIPAFGEIRRLESGLREEGAGHSEAVGQYQQAGRAFADQQWERASQDMPAWQAATLKPAYDMAVNKELTEGAQRVFDAVTGYALASSQDAHIRNAQTLIGQVQTNPASYDTVLGSSEWKAAQDGLGTSPEALRLRRENEAQLGIARLQGDVDGDHWDILQADLTSGAFNFLGDKLGEFENQLLKHGDNAIDTATRTQQLETQMNGIVAYHATQGPDAQMSAADIQFARDHMEPAKFADYINRLGKADQVFKEIGGPIADQTQEKLRSIQPPDPGLLKTDAALYEARMAAYTEAQQQLAAGAKDPAGVMFGTQKGARPRAGEARPGSVDGMGDRLTKEWAPIGSMLTTDPSRPFAAPAPNPAAGKTYASDILIGEYNKGFDALNGGLALIPQQTAAEIVAGFNKALTQDPASLGVWSARLTSLLGSFKDGVTLPHGLTVSPAAIVAAQLQAAGLKHPGLLSAAMGAAAGTSGGRSALDYYMGGLANPELRKPLAGADGKRLETVVTRELGPLTQTMGGPWDQAMNADRLAQVSMIAREMKAQHPGWSIEQAGINAAALLKNDYRSDGTVRMPAGAASEQHDVPFANAPLAAKVGLTVMAGPGGFIPATAKVSGWDLAARGRDLAKAYALADNGANLILPPDDKTPGETLKQYADIVAHNARWVNFGDDVWGYAMMQNNGQYSIVQDKYGRNIMLGAGQAIKDGTANSSMFLKPATPLQTTTTPAGHPNHVVSPPAATAAAAGAIVERGAAPTTPAPANENAPAAVARSEPAPAPPGAGPASQNERQRMLTGLGVDPRVIAHFGDQPAGGAPAAAPPAAPWTPGTGGNSPPGTPSHAAAQFDRLNLTPAQALAMFEPGLIAQEAGGAGVKSPAGAWGKMQIRPGTAAVWAPKVGMMFNEDQLLNDNAYNMRLGTAILSSGMQKYMVGKNPMAGIALALAAYNAGEGAVDGYSKGGRYHPGYLQRYGDPRSGTLTTDEWIDRLPADRYGEPRDYVRRIYERTTSRLAGVYGAGPAPGG